MTASCLFRMLMGTITVLLFSYLAALYFNIHQTAKTTSSPIYTPHPWNLFVRDLTSLETGSLYSVLHLNPVTACHRCSQTSLSTQFVKKHSPAQSFQKSQWLQCLPVGPIKKQEVVSEGWWNWARPTPRVLIPQHRSTEWRLRGRAVVRQSPYWLFFSICLNCMRKLVFKPCTASWINTTKQIMIRMSCFVLEI